MKPGIIILMTALSFCLAGCASQSPQVVFYHLSPLNKTQQDVPATQSEKSVAIGVGPVSFPMVLDRPQLVTRTDSNRYRIDEFHRWGGSLKSEFTVTLAENLSSLLNTRAVTTFPWEKHFQPNYRILPEVLRFDGQLGEFALLDSRWTITSGNGKQPLSVKKSILKTPLPEPGYEAFVKAQNLNLQKLAEQITAEIQQLEQASESLNRN